MGRCIFIIERVLGFLHNKEVISQNGDQPFFCVENNWKIGYQLIIMFVYARLWKGGMEVQVETTCEAFCR